MMRIALPSEEGYSAKENLAITSVAARTRISGAMMDWASGVETNPAQAPP
jgi:hypothetical protein